MQRTARHSLPSVAKRVRPDARVNTIGRYPLVALPVRAVLLCVTPLALGAQISRPPRSAAAVDSAEALDPVYARQVQKDFEVYRKLNMPDGGLIGFNAGNVNFSYWDTTNTAAGLGSSPMGLPPTQFCPVNGLRSPDTENRLQASAASVSISLSARRSHCVSRRFRQRPSGNGRHARYR